MGGRCQWEGDSQELLTGCSVWQCSPGQPSLVSGVRGGFPEEMTSKIQKINWRGEKVGRREENDY